MSDAPIILSFDVEEHDRIEAAAHLPFSEPARQLYAGRMEASTRGILELLARTNTKATFYIVGQIAETHPRLVRDIAEAGHEIGSHSSEHWRIHRHTPETFREDLHRSRTALEQASGLPVVGFRAPTFSLMRETSWAVDPLLETGWEYDSSIFPVRHDRYGVPTAPRVPFWLEGSRGRILELPPATCRLPGMNLPVAGGGYFRLFPPQFMRAGIGQLPVSMLYFHPWEFDPEQPRLPLGRLARWRTYVGIRHSTARLARLLLRYRGRFWRAIDVARSWQQKPLPSFRLAEVA